MAEITSVQIRLKPLITTHRGGLECRLNIDPVVSGRTIARLSIPYHKICFKSDGSAMKTTLIAAFDFLDKAGWLLGRIEQTLPLDMTEGSLHKVIRRDYREEIPPNLTLTNTADESRAHKKVKRLSDFLFRPECQGPARRPALARSFCSF